jgi:hypothetical protein
MGASGSGVVALSGWGWITNQRTWKLPFRGPSTGRLAPRSSLAFGVKDCVLPYLKHLAQIGIALFKRWAPVNDDNGLAPGVVSSDYTTQGALEF